MTPQSHLQTTAMDENDASLGPLALIFASNVLMGHWKRLLLFASCENWLTFYQSYSGLK